MLSAGMQSGGPGGSRAEAVRVPHSPLLKEFSVAPQVSETERLCYVGHNFGSEVMKCNSLCR